MGKRNRVALVVLGDIGRSPRMQYHALSLAQQVIIYLSVLFMYICVYLFVIILTYALSCVCSIMLSSRQLKTVEIILRVCCY